MPYLLLTGATGLLGGHLLRDLLQTGRPVAVLVRRNAVRSARQGIDAMLAPWETTHYLPRPVVVEGDLSKPDLGLSSEDQDWLARNCNAVLHSAASVSFYQEAKSGEPYRTNVDGTRNLIAFCKNAGIEEFHQVSTAYVCGRRSGLVRENELDVGQDLGNDYERSKVAAEKLVHEAGFKTPPTFYRPSIIIGDSQTGFTTTYNGYYTPIQVAWWLAKSGTFHQGEEQWFLNQLGLSGDERKNIVPVDWVSRAILHLLANPIAHGRTYHLTNPEPPASSDLAAAITTVIRERLQREGSAKPDPAAPAEMVEADFRRHMDVYRAYFRDHPVFDTAHLQQFAADVPCPRVDLAMLTKTGRFALDGNFGWPRRAIEKPRCDAAEFIEFSARNAGGPVGLRGSLEITGPGGGTWTFAGDASGQPLPLRGKIGTISASLRVSTQTLAALIEGRWTASEAVYAGRIVVSGLPEDCDLFVTWMDSNLSRFSHAPGPVNGTQSAGQLRRRSQEVVA